MPPGRIVFEMRSAGMPASRATIVSASSDDCRCWVSKSAGTYSASITGVIGNTLSNLTRPPEPPVNSAALAIAGFAYSASARSIGTRMFLNICVSFDPTWKLSFFFFLLLRLLLLAQQGRTDQPLEATTSKRQFRPACDRTCDHCEPCGRQIIGERAIRGVELCRLAVAGKAQRQCELMQAGIVADDHQAFGTGAVRQLLCVANDA